MSYYSSNPKKCCKSDSRGWVIWYIILIEDTYEWYCACRKLNSSLILSNVSAIVNFIGPCGGGPCK